MFNKSLVQDILEQVLEATYRVLNRFEHISSVEDFTNSPEGLEKLDSICMPIIAIGESLKQIDKITGNELLSKYSQIDWKGAKGMRDIISHHYFDIDAEEIFWVCKHQIKPLSNTIKEIIKDLS